MPVDDSHCSIEQPPSKQKKQRNGVKIDVCMHMRMQQLHAKKETEEAQTTDSRTTGAVGMAQTTVISGTNKKTDMKYTHTRSNAKTRRQTTTDRSKP